MYKETSYASFLDILLLYLSIHEHGDFFIFMSINKLKYRSNISIVFWDYDYLSLFFYLIWGTCCISVQKFIYPLIKVTLWLKKCHFILFFDCDKRKKNHPEIWLYRRVHAFLVIIYQLSCRLHLSGLTCVNKSSRFKRRCFECCVIAFAKGK